MPYPILPHNSPDLEKFTSRKVKVAHDESLSTWIERYLALAVTGVRSEAVTQKITLHLERFRQFFLASYGQERLGNCVKRDVLVWQQVLKDQDLAASTINNHLASLSAFTTWVARQAPAVFAAGDPAKGIRALALPPLEPRALSLVQIRSLKNLCDRLPRFHQRRGRRWQGREAPVNAHGRPWRDRALVFLLLSTGLRREEITQLDLDQVEPNTPAALRAAHRARIVRVQGKGKTERTVFLSADARQALADYLHNERLLDGGESTPALFLSATSLAARQLDGRLSPRAINRILEQIGRWHDAEVSDPERWLSPLQPHALRHYLPFLTMSGNMKDLTDLFGNGRSHHTGPLKIPDIVFSR
jgi:site-specific recombinase XerD